MERGYFIPIRDMVLFPGVIVPIFVGREKSLKVLKKVLEKNNELLLFLQNDKNLEKPNVFTDIATTGVKVKIIQTVNLPDGTIKILCEVLTRVESVEIILRTRYYEAMYQEMTLEEVEFKEKEAMKRKILDYFENHMKLNSNLPTDLITSLRDLEDVEKIFNLLATNLNISDEKKQKLLEIKSLKKFGLKILVHIEKELEILNMERIIENKVKNQLNDVQKGYYLREKMKIIKEELGDNETLDDEIEDLKSKILNAKMPNEVKEKLLKEVNKLSKMPPFSSETSVIRNYVETILEIPWNKKSKDTLDIKYATRILDEDHYGLKEVKERILEFLAVKQLNKKISGTILCLVGPPGVGKTSLAKSVARAMNKKFVRTALGGVRDEAEIRGHRKTYVGAMPGRIINCLKIAKTNNPVFLLDEVDKLSNDYKGDPTSALLEVLDPEQNIEFRDNYVDMAFDLSNVFFIATANDKWAIPEPLRDRLEIITLNSYTEVEKFHIAKDFLISRAITENGLNKYDVKVLDAIPEIINHYTKEAGIRQLQREINKIFRKLAKEILEKKKKKFNIEHKDLKKYLGNIKFRSDAPRKKITKIGIVNGLAWTIYGGTILEVQSAKMDGKGKIILTGKLGDVMKESARVAHSFIRANKKKYDITLKNFEEKIDIHVHFPEGAVPKDGPSAGITITTALISVLADAKVRYDVAMTGEMTISGEVLPIGGLLEKVIAAHKANIKEVIMPFDNKDDLEKVPDIIKKDMKFHFVKKYDEVAKIIFVKKS